MSNRIPVYRDTATGDFWKRCKTCEFSEAKEVSGKLYCKRKKSPKRMRKDRRVDPNGLCGYFKDAEIPFIFIIGALYGCLQAML